MTMTTESPTLNEQHVAVDDSLLASKLNDTSKKRAYSLANRLSDAVNLVVACLVIVWRGWCEVCASIWRGLNSMIPPDELETHAQARGHDVPLVGLVIALLALLLKPLVVWVGVDTTIAYVDAAAVTIIAISTIVLGVRGYHLRKKDNDGNAGQNCG